MAHPGYNWTAMGAINAIPDVCDAAPGWITHLDLGWSNPAVWCANDAKWLRNGCTTCVRRRIGAARRRDAVVHRTRIHLQPGRTDRTRLSHPSLGLGRGIELISPDPRLDSFGRGCRSMSS